MGNRWSTGYIDPRWTTELATALQVGLMQEGMAAALGGTNWGEGVAVQEDRLRAIVREEIEAAETRRRLEARPGELEALTARWRYAAGRR